jgi:type IX secretion system PorP/SprF family membrane protein
MDASLSINGVYRSQWIGIPGNPVQQNVNAHMPFYLLNGAFGISINNESIGAEKTTAASVSYNYVLDTDYGLFSFGGGVGMLQKSLDGTILKTPEGEYEGPTINHLDGNLPNGLEHGISPQFSAGIYYAGDYFEGGIAVNQLVLGNINFGESITYHPKAAVNVFGEYFIESLDLVKIYPGFFVQSDFVQTQIEGSVRIVYDDFVTGGLSVRGYSQNTLDALVIFGGLKLSDHLTIAYAYDLTLSALNQASSGTHEVMLKYNLNRIIGAGLPPRVIYNPRFL